MSGGIYTIFCKGNGTFYIGSAKNFEKRFKDHLANLQNNRHCNPHLQRAFNKYGQDLFNFEIFKCLGDYDKNLYFEEENAVINKFRLDNIPVFNVAKAEGGWTFATHERKADIAVKISNSLKEYYATLTQEQRNEIYGATKRNVPLSDLHKQKTSEGLKGKKKSEETKRKMSEAQKGKPHLVELGRSVGKSNKGRKPPNIRKVLIDDIEFDSVADAALYFGISSSAIIHRIKRKNNESNRYVWKENEANQW